LTKLTWAQFQSQIERTNAAVGRATGDAPECIRPPYGITNRNVLLRAQKFHMPLVMWSIDSRDWARPGTSRIVRNVMSKVKDGSIVLMHDGGGPRAQTVAALKVLLPSLRKQGYAIRALPCGVNR
jgi:peptidoglycan/xylan/chitin deacetylase (PgdA/CDA1 family)